MLVAPLPMAHSGAAHWARDLHQFTSFLDATSLELFIRTAIVLMLDRLIVSHTDNDNVNTNHKPDA